MTTEADVQTVQKAIRAPHSYDFGARAAIASLPGVTLRLRDILDEEGTPWWDRTDGTPPDTLATLVAVYPSGEKTEIPLSEVPTWEALAERVLPSAANIDAARTELELAAAREAELLAALEKARKRRDQAMIAAESLGITRYRIAKITGKSQAGVKKILDAAKR